MWVVGRITDVFVSDLPRRCSSWRVAAKSRSSSPSSNCLSASERSLGSTCRDDNFSARLTSAQRSAAAVSGAEKLSSRHVLPRDLSDALKQLDACRLKQIRRLL